MLGCYFYLNPRDLKREDNKEKMVIFFLQLYKVLNSKEHKK